MPSYDAIRFEPPAPCAYVTIRNPDTGAAQPDVWMLLDTGADTTLIPQASVRAVGAMAEPDRGYELMGFDGSTSVAPVARLELLFLGRSFKGLFCSQ